MLAPPRALQCGGAFQNNPVLPNARCHAISTKGANLTCLPGVRRTTGALWEMLAKKKPWATSAIEVYRGPRSRMPGY